MELWRHTFSKNINFQVHKSAKKRFKPV